MKLHVVLILLPTVALLAQKPENFGAGAVQGDGESMLINQAADEKIKRSRVLPRQLIPIQYFLGLPISLRTEGVNMGISYRFSKGRELRGYRNLYESFYWYPRLRLGFINTQLWGTYSGGGYSGDELETFVYGLIEGHRYWEGENLLRSVFVGIGLGRHSYEAYPKRDKGIGIMLSVGARARVWRLTGDLRFLRSPGLGNIIPLANVEYQPKSFKEAWIIGAIGGVSALVFTVLFYLGPYLGPP